MKSRRHSRGTGLAMLAAVILASTAWTAWAAGHGSKESDEGAFVVSFQSALDPIEINKMHEWTLHVETAAGDPVEDAEITVDGGMPAHNHGLPTQPQVTEYLGNGDYRVQGLRFHMGGQWQVSFGITAGDTSDTVTFELAL